ncbi:Asd/ArgC dimerization domain-containing protein [Chitinilyticum aquatile]|uniref:Asd/ArgC dimerization domain-containing protein n=1 Tax=Chitinilyticum aquatile TaxID=362520 RepID=UPI00041B5BD1|nr:Asd/ArgC dimerization domain-containing protein [Chitinilyticum aquatile]
MAGLKLALIGATPTFLELLADSGLAVTALYPLAAEDDGSLLEHGDEAWPVMGLADFDFEEVDLLLFLADAPLSAKAIPQALAAGLTVVDASHSGAEAASGSKGRLLALPHMAALLLARPLQALQQLGSVIEAASASVFLPVSAAGQAGVDELSEQVRGLFAHGELSQKVFSKRIAFNLLPETSASLRAGMDTQLARLANGLQLATLQIIHMPVFYGMSAALTVRLESASDAAAVRAALAANEGLLLLPEGQVVSTQDVIGADKVWVGNVDVSADGRTLQLWLLADNARLQAMSVLAVLLQLRGSVH